MEQPTDTKFPDVQRSVIEESSFFERLQQAKNKLRSKLIGLRNDEGFWEGKLSTSALSTATAVSALSLCRRAVSSSSTRPPASPSQPATSVSQPAASARDGALKSGCDGDADARISRWDALIRRGVAWLLDAQNEDGGFGDTERSHSNIATTLLVLSALALSGNNDGNEDLVKRAWEYVERKGKWEGLRKRYGKDKTFVVPILTNCALAGLADWKQVSPLPFEAAALPQSWYRFAQMPVVSYAVPALVAIGQAQHHFRPSRFPPLNWFRSLFIPKTLRVLRSMQPESGGYLEAVPLTSFVLMSLAAMGKSQMEVAANCIRFIEESVLEDGSWPIDTNLATWVTSLTTRAVCDEPNVKATSGIRGELNFDDLIAQKSIDWLLSCQYQVRHPFTGAKPGGWGWTNLSGAVPDADDTPAAIIALSKWMERTGVDRVEPNLRAKIQHGIETGIDWLLDLQNRDGGWPTFCRGWGKLPFDRSGCDLTAHAIRAMLCSMEYRSMEYATEYAEGSDNRGSNLHRKARMDHAIDRGLLYLKKQQRDDGSWLPLWFGNQDDPAEENPVYGTSRVLLALLELREKSKSSEPRWFGAMETISKMIQNGLSFLQRCQNSDGGWGGGPSVRYPMSAVIPGLKSNSGGEYQSANRVGENVIFRTQKPSEGGKEIRNGSENPVVTPSVSTVEETALALEAIAASDTHPWDSGFIMGPANWLCNAVEQDWVDTSWPIGFYFAKLWYHEQMYPIVYTLAALQKCLKHIQ